MTDIFRAFFDPSIMDQQIRNEVKDFILKVSRNEDAKWPTGRFTIFRGDKLILVARGDNYADYDSEIYLRHRSSDHLPEWVIGVLSASAQYWFLHNDLEVSQALLSIVSRRSANMFRSVSGALASSFSGLNLTYIAINSQDNRLAGLYPPDPEDPNGAPRWLEAITGQPINVEGEDNWSIVSLGT